jgi:biotin transport system substrate-specific component
VVKTDLPATDPPDTGKDIIEMTPTDLRSMVLASLFAALTAVGALIALPIGPVPIVLQNFFAMLMALLLGPRWALAGIGVYLLAGALGLPVFAGGTSGLARFAGPTGGYLVGYLPCVALIGWISARGRGHRMIDALAMVCGTAALYACGAAWLKLITGLTWGKALGVGVIPFLPGDIAKIIAAVLVIKTLRQLTHRSGEPREAVPLRAVQ